MSTYLFELAVTHLVLILAYWLVLSKENQYNKMRLFLLGATIFSIIVPLFRLPKLFPTEYQTTLIQHSEVIPVTGTSVSSIAEVPFTFFDYALLLSFLISCILLVKLLANIFFIITLERRNTYESFDGFKIIRVPSIRGSFTFFNRIFIRADIKKNQMEYDAIIKHEEAHVQLKHSYDLIFFQIYKALFWWLPSSWYINAEIKKIHEYQADAYALRSINIGQYSSILINTTLQSNGLTIVSSFHDGLIFKRLKAMNHQVKKVNQWKYVTLVSMYVFLFGLFACTEESSNLNAQDSHSDKPQNEREEVIVEEIFKIVEQQPSYKGGMSTFYNYLKSEMRYPLEARKSGAEGTVHVHFVIERDGSVSNVRAIDGIGSGCDKMAVRLVKQANGFTPGIQRGRAVRVAMSLPITFNLQPEKKNPDNSVQGTIIVGEIKTNNGALEVKAKTYKGKWSGTVFTPEGDVLPGANILVAGTNKGTVSDMDGSFNITIEEGQELHISFVGYTGIVLGG